MKVSQAGYRNTVATLGAKISANQVKLIRRFFDSVIIFSDNDDAGSEMRDAIIEECRGKELFTVSIPDGLKDPGDMTQEQIVHAIENRKLHTGD